MRINVIKAYLKKEFIDLIRNKMIILTYLIPAMILILFGFGIKMEVTHARTVIIDNDHSKLSLEIINKFSHTKYFDVKVENLNYKEALHKLQTNKADMIIIIPPSFSKNLYKGAQIGVYIDGSFPLRAITLQGYVEKVLINGFNIKLPIKIENRNFFNESMRDYNAIVPGLFGLIFLVVPASLAAIMIVKEKEVGTIFNFYSAPITKIEFIISKLIPPFLFHSVNIFILLILALYLFDVPFRGNLFIFWVASEIYILISVGIGLLVSVITSTQIAALVLSVIITVIPGFLYSGILMPISSMGKESLIEAHIFPVMYYNHLVYDSFLVGEGFKSGGNILYFLILCGYALGVILVGTFFVKKAIK